MVHNGKAIDAMKSHAKSGCVYVGIGGWTYPPWRGVFYPKGLPQSQELAFATAQLTSIEINATFYRLQKPASFRKWAEVAPDGFAFSLKAPRLLTHRAELAEGADFMRRFFDSGLLELGDRLGPILWQFPPNKGFESTDFGKFLELLPQTIDGRKLHHVVEGRHDSFSTPEFVRLLRGFGVTSAYSESDAYPDIADVTGDIVYARLQKGQDTIATGYKSAALDKWAERARIWAEGSEPKDLSYVDAAHPSAARPRDVFIYFIHGGKLRAPAAATALIERLA